VDLRRRSRRPDADRRRCPPPHENAPRPCPLATTARDPRRSTFRGDPGCVADTTPVSAPPPPCRTDAWTARASTKIHGTPSRS